MSQEVLAVVAGEEITQEEFDAFLLNVPRDRQVQTAVFGAVDCTAFVCENGWRPEAGSDREI